MKSFNDIRENTITESVDYNKLTQLARYGLVDKGNVQKLIAAFKKMEDGKALQPAQRELMLSVLTDLTGIITGDAQMFQKAKNAVKEGTFEEAMDHFVYQKGVSKTKEVVHRGTEQSSKDWIEKNAKHFGHKGKDFDIYKGKYPNVKPSDRLDYRYVAEEVEELDELSKKTLGSYVKKASDDRAQNAFNVGKSGKINFKGLKRRQGINRATNKLTKEEVNLDEVSNTVKDQLRNIELEIGRLNRRYGSGDIGDTGSMSAPAKIQRLTKQFKDIMKKHGMKEDTQIDEISQGKLQSYHAAAGADLQKKREKLNKGTLTMKDLRHGQNRVKGLNRSADKMSEDTQIDEISMGTPAAHVDMVYNQKKEATYSDTGWRKPEVKKDRFGNVIKDKNVAKTLAKSGLRQTKDMAKK